MIPLQLRVRNFMCYRDDVPPLDFDGIHLACLTGANGHGKSALLDAITWVLWGKARAKREDELIHLGQSEMEVELTFDLGGTVYRVLRKRDSSQRGRTLLDLQVQTSGGQFDSLAEPGLRATQEAIIRLLRLDYDTFTNSAFLLQGRADAFTTRPPAERKQVLGDILGLSLYDEYEQRAKDRVRETERQIAELDGLLRDVDRELAHEEEYQAELAAAEAHVAELSTAVKDAESLLHDVRADQQRLQLQQTRLQDLERRLAQAERELADVEAQIGERQVRLAGYQAVLAGRQEVEDGYAALLDARQAEASCGERLARYAGLHDRQREVERRIDAARRDLDLAQGRLGERVRDLDRRAGSLPGLQQQLASAQARLAHLDGRQAERDAAQERLQSLAEELAGVQVRNEGLRAEMNEAKEKLDLLQREAGEAACPLCGQTLSPQHLADLVTQFTSEGTALAGAFRANASRGREIAAESKRLTAAVQEMARELAALSAEQRREAQLDQAIAQATDAAGELETARGEMASLQARLDARDYASAEFAQLAELAAELAALGYDRAEHDAARARVAALLDFEVAYHGLRAAQERIDDERTALDDLRARQERWSEANAHDAEQRDALRAEVARLPDVTARAESAARFLEDLRAQSSRARQALGAAQQKLDHCRYLAAERERHEANRRERVEEKSLLDELRLAFGKKGIQAIIIEAAVPEIEYEANRLLARMTGGQMHVRFETQRETLKGDTVETLDINIADELGTRPYELFSGGEAFRVNFAIRIALSKLLARRAGAQLQMLVIDEGFGTQDADGRERLVEAITSIQDDFARILVVTHIEELKDAFPVRIDVVKTPAGSHITVN